MRLILESEHLLRSRVVSVLVVFRLLDTGRDDWERALFSEEQFSSPGKIMGWTRSLGESKAFFTAPKHFGKFPFRKNK